jgi:hypothetical protein
MNVHNIGALIRDRLLNKARTEKLEALTSLGMPNSRMKDFFDLRILAKYSDFDGGVLSRAVAATFERRRTSFPSGIPIGLSDEFVTDAQKEKP